KHADVMPRNAWQMDEPGSPWEEMEAYASSRELRESNLPVVFHLRGKVSAYGQMQKFQSFVQDELIPTLDALMKGDAPTLTDLHVIRAAQREMPRMYKSLISHEGDWFEKGLMPVERIATEQSLRRFLHGLETRITDALPPGPGTKPIPFP
ncbi:MAG: hypothetical protein K2Q01_03765, partial [Rickettsiales bacterium]|nr:hypothetical protein [Rickettsiales bacterium]